MPGCTPSAKRARRAALSVTNARVLRRDKDRTKTQEDRDVELCPRALQVLKRHVALREKYVADGRSTPGVPQKNAVDVNIWKLGKKQ